MKCFYHSADMDGLCSAAIVYKYYNGDGEYIPIDYNEKFPFYDVKPDETVIIVDFSLQQDGDFDKLRKITSNIIWIDHHKTAIAKHAFLDKELDGIRRSGTAGCELTWEYFFPNKPVPRVVQLLGDYDVWSLKYGKETAWLQTGIQLEDAPIGSHKWTKWLSDGYNPQQEVSNGRIASKYQHFLCNKLILSHAFSVDFDGYTVAAINFPIWTSELPSFFCSDIDIVMAFSYDGVQWRISLRSVNDNIDVSEIAKRYGGGGHKGSGGFICNELSFDDGKVTIK